MDFTLRKSELFPAQQCLLGLAHFATRAVLTAAEFLAAAAGAAACLHSILRGNADLDAVLVNIRVRCFCSIRRGIERARQTAPFTLRRRLSGRLSSMPRSLTLQAT